MLKLVRKYTISRLCQTLGCVNAIVLLVKGMAADFLPFGDTLSLRTKSSKFPMVARTSTSDLSVFSQIFIELEYACIDDLKHVGLILDCGANVGYSSCYFLSRFAESRVVCVEPDLENYSLLSNNLRYFGDRVSLVHGGIWSHSTRLRIRSNVYRDGGKWAVQVEETEDKNDSSIQAFGIKELLDSSGYERISLLKMDIEGAEVVVFSGDCDEWLSKVDNIVIELHDDSVFGMASDIVVSKIMQSNRFEMSRHGELTVFKSLS